MNNMQLEWVTELINFSSFFLFKLRLKSYDSVSHWDQPMNLMRICITSLARVDVHYTPASSYMEADIETENRSLPKNGHKSRIFIFKVKSGQVRP